jgi:hypothetical protein
MVVSEVRRSVSLKGKSGGFKVDACNPVRDCICCCADPPTLSGKVIWSLGSEFCKIPAKHISDEELQKKKIDKKGVVAVKADWVNKKGSNQDEDKKAKKTWRVLLLKIFTFCAFSFVSMLMDMSGNICGISFGWWSFVGSYEPLSCIDMEAAELLWGAFCIDDESPSVVDIYMAYMILLLVLFSYALSMQQFLGAIMLDCFSILFSMFFLRDGPEVLMAYSPSLFING